MFRERPGRGRTYELRRSFPFAPFDGEPSEESSAAPAGVIASAV
jgi:hypothetical protein